MMVCTDNNCEFDLVTVFDNPDYGIAYNLYQCNICGTLCKHDVWKYAGKLFIKPDNTISKNEEVKI